MAADKHFTYKDAGVDVAAGNEAVRLLKERLTVDPPSSGARAASAASAGSSRLPPVNDPVLVAGTDGAGTKVMLAREMGVFDTIGIDAVAMSVNDVSACGAVPLFFLDYLVVGKVDPQTVADIVAGVDEGCLRAQCALLGGETAEHPGHFADDDAFDLAGFASASPAAPTLWGRRRASRPATPSSASPPTACTPTASGSCGACCSATPSTRRSPSATRLGGSADAAGRRRRAGGDLPAGATSATSCSPRPPSTARVLAELGHACARARRGPHHGRRLPRQRRPRRCPTARPPSST